MGPTGIPYLELGWNPVVGCSGDGCKANCWARALHGQRHKAYHEGKKVPAQYAKPFHEVQCLPERLDEILHRRKPAVIGACFTSELFDRQVPDEFLHHSLHTMAMCGEHTLVLLTKQAQRMHDFLSAYQEHRYDHSLSDWRAPFARTAVTAGAPGKAWPLPNIHLGVSVTDQADADERLPHLCALAAQGWKTWVSYGPALGPIEWRDEWLGYTPPGASSFAGRTSGAGIGGIIMECEAGPGARWPERKEWRRMVRGTRDACAATGVPFYLKQEPDWEHPGRVVHAPLLDGRQWLDLPWQVKP